MTKNLEKKTPDFIEHVFVKLTIITTKKKTFERSSKKCFFKRSWEFYSCANVRCVDEDRARSSRDGFRPEREQVRVRVRDQKTSSYLRSSSPPNTSTIRVRTSDNKRVKRAQRRLFSVEEERGTSGHYWWWRGRQRRERRRRRRWRRWVDAIDELTDDGSDVSLKLRVLKLIKNAGEDPFRAAALTRPSVKDR